MTKKPRERRREGKPEEPGGLWLTVARELLKGGVVAALAAVLALGVCALLISGGVIPEGAMDRAALAAGVLGALMGGLLAVRKVGRSTLLVGVGVGAILFLILLSAGLLLFEDTLVSNGGLSVLMSCLCGGAMAGILGSRPKKKRKR